MSLEEAGKVKDPRLAMETCPFCGKTFKRLKSHLPHCKLAGAKNDSSETVQAKKSPKMGTKRALLEAKEQYLKNEGEDNMKTTKKTQVIKKNQKHLESCRTQETMLEEKEKKNVKSHVQKSNLDQVHDNSHLIDKEGNRSGCQIVEDPTSADPAILQHPEASMSLVQTGAIHVAAAQSHIVALPAMPGGAESSEDILTWPSHKEEFRGAILEEKMGSAGIKLHMYEEVSKVLEDVMEKEDHCRSRNDFKGSVNGKHSQKPENQYLELPSEPSSSLLLPTMVSSSYRLKSQFPRHREHAQLTDISHQLQTPDSEALKSTKKSLEGPLQICSSNALNSTSKSLVGQLDLTPANETNTFLPVRDVLSGNHSLGLHWFPELHSNYFPLKIVPGKLDLMSFDSTMGKSIAPGPADSEFCKSAQTQLIPEVPLTSRRLMNVRIGELPSWLALQRFSMKTIPELGLRAWTRYYNKYINVRKGGIGGLTMILVGYCTLSYTWNYHHIRQDRWRKYH